MSGTGFRLEKKPEQMQTCGSGTLRFGVNRLTQGFFHDKLAAISFEMQRSGLRAAQSVSLQRAGGW